MKFFKYTFITAAVLALAALALLGVYRLFPLRYTAILQYEAAENGVDKYLAAALIKAESNFTADAVSIAEAKGLMQLTDATALYCAGQLGVQLNDGDIYDPEINIKLGMYYLKLMLERFGGNEDLAVAAYNAGEGNVANWLSDPSYSTDGESLDTIPYSETESHVKKIAFYKRVYKLLYPNL